MKSYTYKHYAKNGEFIQVIDEKAITSQVSFSESMNAPQGNLNISLNISWEKSNFQKGDYIKVFVNNKYFKNGYQIYYGYIEEIEKQANTNESITLVCYGVGALLSKVFYKKDGLYAFNSNGTASQQINFVLTHFESEYPGVITSGDIDEPAGSLYFSVDYRYSLDFINSIVNAKKETHFFYIDREGKLNFKAFADTKEHFITFQKDIQELTQREDVEIINRIHFEYATGSKIYDNAASISKYGIREIRKSDMRIQNESTADSIAEGIFEESADPFPSIDLVLNDTFELQDFKIWNDNDIWDDNDIWLTVTGVNGYEGIEIGDKVKILNRRQQTLGFVRKKIYTRDNLQLVIGRYENLISLIRNDDNTNL